MRKYKHIRQIDASGLLGTLAFPIRFMFLFILVFSAPVAFSQAVKPFAPGEKLEYVLKWEFIRAGKAVLEVAPMEELEGEQAFKFVMTARSRSFIDHFYKVRDRIDAYTDKEMNHSLLYKKNQLEGKTHREIIVRFDWNENKALYTNFGRPRSPIPILPGSFDPLSAFYFTRFFELKDNTVIERPITDGKKCVIGRAKVVGRETITISSGTYDTFIIEPELEHVGGIFEKSEDAAIHVWVTADHRKIPVKIKSKVVVGSFIGELVSATGLTDPPQPVPPPNAPAVNKIRGAD